MKKKKEIKQLKSEVETLKERISKLESRQVYNNRNAGRKPKFNRQQKQQIYNDRLAGMTIVNIAKKYHCGTTTVNRIIRELKQAGK